MSDRASPSLNSWGAWVLANALGLAAALAVSLTGALPLLKPLVSKARLVGSTRDYLVSAAALAIGGLLLGLAQWLVLRRHVSRACWWILASAVAWAPGVAIGLAVALLLAYLGGFVVGFAIPHFLGFAIGISVGGVGGGAVGGAVSAVVLGLAAWLVLRRSFSEAVTWLGVGLASWVVGLALALGGAAAAQLALGGSMPEPLLLGIDSVIALASGALGRAISGGALSALPPRR